MKFKSCYGDTFELNEGDLVVATFNNESDEYEVIGIAVPSLGVILDEDGCYTNLTDMIDLDDKGIADKAQVERILGKFNKDMYIFDDCAKIARNYINETKEEDILPLKYNLFNNKEELLNYIDSIS